MTNMFHPMDIQNGSISLSDYVYAELSHPSNIIPDKLIAKIPMAPYVIDCNNNIFKYIIYNKQVTYIYIGGNFKEWGN